MPGEFPERKFAGQNVAAVGGGRIGSSGNANAEPEGEFVGFVGFVLESLQIEQGTADF